MYRAPLPLRMSRDMAYNRRLKLDQTTIDAAAKALLDAAPPGSRVILFVSYAKGTARPDSDIDFLVVEPTVKYRMDEMFRLRKAVVHVFEGEIQRVDVILTDDEHFQRSKDVFNTLAFEAATTGQFYEWV